MNRKYLISKDCSSLQFGPISDKYITLVSKKNKKYTLDKVEELIKILKEKKKNKEYEIITNIEETDEHYPIFCFLKWIIVREITKSNIEFNKETNEFKFIINQASLNISIDQQDEQIQQKTCGCHTILIKNLNNLKDNGIDKYIKKKLNQMKLNHFELFNGIYGYYETKVIIENDFFNIWLDKLDSSALIIGKNGSGKTRFLKWYHDNFNTKCETHNIIYISDVLVFNFGESESRNNFFTDFKLKYHSNLKKLINTQLLKYKLTYEFHSIVNNIIYFKTSNYGNNNSNEEHKELFEYKDLSTGEKSFFVLISWVSHIAYLNGNNQSLIKAPKLLILDEIETAMHSESLCYMFEILKENSIKFNIHILLSTHSATTIRISAGFNFKYYLIDRDKNEKVTIKDIKSYEEAINNVSGGKLSVVDDTKLVLVEDEDDRNFYTLVYKKLFEPDKNPSKTRLVFCEAGAKRFDQNILDNMVNDLLEISKEYSESKLRIDKIISTLKSSNNIGGCTEVKKKVKLLSQKLEKSFKLGSSQVIGLIDSDDGQRNLSLNNVVTIGYYSFEMYLCFPLVLYYLDCNKSLIDQKKQDPNELVSIVIDDLIKRESTIQIKHGDHHRTRIDYLYQNSIRSCGSGSSNKRFKGIGSNGSSIVTTAPTHNDILHEQHPLKTNLQTVILLDDETIESEIETKVKVPLVFTEGIGEGGERGHFLLQSLALIYYYDKNKSYSAIFKEFSQQLYKAYEKLPNRFIPQNLKVALKNVMTSTGNDK